MAATQKKSSKKKSKTKKKTKKKWSQKVNEQSDALTLKDKLFKQSPPKIAKSLKHSAESSKKKKAKSSYQSAMSMLNFYINRAGKNLSASQKKRLEKAKENLREIFHRN